RLRFLSEFTSSIIFLFCSSASSETEKYALPSASMVISTTSFSRAISVATEDGVTTLSSSEGLNLLVKMKKDNSRKATSHIAVMSTAVLFLGTLILAYSIFSFLIRCFTTQDSINFPAKLLLIYTEKRSFV